MIETPPRSGGPRDAPLLAGLGAVFAMLYVATAAPHLLGGDAGELAAIGAAGGVAHPPGYPLYVLLLRSLSWLPASSPAHRASLATALVGAGAVVALAWACMRHGVRREIALATATLFGTSTLAWSLATQPEVFSLNVLLAMGIVGLSAPPREAHEDGEGRQGSEEHQRRRRRGAARRAFSLGLLAGLGLANHHSIVLLAPIGIAGALSAVLAAPSRGRAAALAMLGLAIGLTPYLYLVVVARTVPLESACAWGQPRDLASLVRHFLRTDYGTTRLAISEAEAEPGAQLLFLASAVVVQLAFVPALALGLTTLSLARRGAIAAPDRGGRRRIALLFASFLLAGPVFVARFNLPARGLSAHIVERFHLLPMALAAVLSAIVIEAALAARRAEARRGHVAATLVFVGAVTGGATSLPRVVDAHRPSIERYLRNLLALSPPNAIIVGGGDDISGASLYQRCALHVRPDVEIVSPRLLLGSWYPAQVSARLGFPIVRGEPRPGETVPRLAYSDLLVQLLDTGRPVLITAWVVPDVAKVIPSYPIGPLVRLVRSPGEVPPPDALLARNLEVLEKMELDPTAAPDDTWGGARARDYARPFEVLARAYEAAGDADRAQACRAKAAALLAR